MKRSILYIVLLAAACQTPEKQTNTTIISQPVVIEDEGWKFEGTENILLVPENRNQERSRKIGLHFFQFPAREKSNLPPVVFLGAGPGEPYSVDVFYDGRRAEAWRFELNFVNQNRDVILINQRGNSNAPGLSIANFRYKWNNGGTLDKPFDLELMNNNRKEAYAKYIREYTARGIDLRGYDAFHFIDDIDEVRKHLNYDKIALIGNSFASQWALGYIQRYPTKVDRALLSGIEPLDNNYDDPNGIWQVLEQINRYATADPKIAQELPEIGLIEMLKTVISRLESEPATATIIEDGEEIKVVLGADDLRFNMMYPNATSYASEIESWPKYITEMFNGDFRVLAAASIGRIYNSSSLMINPLFNNSLGISEEREKMLNNRSSKKWLGNLNAHYTSTRDICPAPKVPENFLLPTHHKIPMILIQGDMDKSTPYANATSLMNFLENGHLLTVKRGFHNAKRALIFQDSLLVNTIYNFMNLDFEVDNFQDYKSMLPGTYEMPRFNFWSLADKPLYEKEQN